jgi:hypothetical protein
MRANQFNRLADHDHLTILSHGRFGFLFLLKTHSDGQVNRFIAIYYTVKGSKRVISADKIIQRSSSATAYLRPRIYHFNDKIGDLYEYPFILLAVLRLDQWRNIQFCDDWSSHIAYRQSAYLTATRAWCIAQDVGYSN